MNVCFAGLSCPLHEGSARPRGGDLKDLRQRFMVARSSSEYAMRQGSTYRQPYARGLRPVNRAGAPECLLRATELPLVWFVTMAA